MGFVRRSVRARTPAYRALVVVSMLALAAGCYTGEGSGVVALKSYDVAAFSGIALSSDGTVTVLPGEFAVTASAEDNVLPTLRVQTKDDTLVVWRDVDWIDGVRPTVPIRFNVTVPQLANVAVSGSGRVVVRAVGSPVVDYSVSGAGALDLVDVPANRVRIAVDGSGTVSASGIRATEFAVELRGAAQAVLAGTTDVATIDVSGSVLYRGAHLRARQVDARIDGAGQAFAWADETLQGYVGGIAGLGYRGSPALAVEIRRDGRLFPVAVPLPPPSED